MKLRAACMCCEQPFTVSEDESAQDIARRILSRTIALTNYPWFTRLWVVQEVALGVSATLYCGAYYAPWRAFKELLDQTRTPLMQTHVAIAAVEPVDRFTPDELLASLVKFRSRGCFLKHDRVYAIRVLHGLEGAGLLVTNYNLSYLDVYRETVLLCLARMKKPGRQIPHCALLLALPGVQDAYTDTELAAVGDTASWTADFSKLNEHSARKLHAYSWPVSFQFKESCQHSLAFLHRDQQPDALEIKGFRFAAINEVLGIETPDPRVLRDEGRFDSAVTATMVTWAQQCRSFMLTGLGPISTDVLHRATYQILNRDNHPTGGIKLVRRGRERKIVTDGDDGDDQARLRYALQPLLEISDAQRFDFTARLAKVRMSSSDPDSPIETKLAWVPRDARVGDLICFVRGSPFAIVLRVTDTKAYRLLGDTWMYGLVEDHVVAGASIAGEEWISFKLFLLRRTRVSTSSAARRHGADVLISRPSSAFLGRSLPTDEWSSFVNARAEYTLIIQPCAADPVTAQLWTVNVGFPVSLIGDYYKTCCASTTDNETRSPTVTSIHRL